MKRNTNMLRHLRMKCPKCGHWNRVPVNKIFVERKNPRPKVKVLIPMYEPLEVAKCRNCGTIVAEPMELIKMVKNQGSVV